MQHGALSSFSMILLFIIGSALFLLGGLFAAYLLAPRKPNHEKLSTYECGEQPVGHAWGQFNFRFYTLALIFILFEIETVLLFPWAIVFGQKELIEATQGRWAWFAFIEALVFIGLLLAGLLYAWRRGFLDWARPRPKVPSVHSPVPHALYENVNRRYSPSSKQKA
ncbi:MAG: hypothetical protein KatS3mg033_1543 [Thermonema sp.]|uniref:NADH-quinone oxidoreductase subunit A n=1 Tax=Thermonema sp. TaxID=2231181 RepID=UPI0021DD4B9D|nr:NADH-quinone oxidoreductase subunit A [Thermonema sp.]GIV39743.1 MAG: hypothetical protein KatS3mg033_1543 [Thermonema sp.]